MFKIICRLEKSLQNNFEYYHTLSYFKIKWAVGDIWILKLWYKSDADRLYRQGLVIEKWRAEVLENIVIKNGQGIWFQDGEIVWYKNRSSWDFLLPWTAEFRGIYELYGLVMYKLIIVFSIMLGCIIHCYYKSISLAFEQRNECIDIICLYPDFLDGIDAARAHLIRLSATRFFEECEKNKNISSIYDIILEKTNLESNNFTGRFKKIISFLSTLSARASFWAYYSVVEFYWTLIPCIILIFISIPSFTLALALDETHKPEMWIKIVGNQWYWLYEYSAYDKNLSIYSNIVYGPELGNNALRILELDTCIVLPVNSVTRLLITSTDVIHCWAVPSLGIKIDAVPGRINSLSILPQKVGFYYGQCSEICGVNHGFMPICVEVI